MQLSLGFVIYNKSKGGKHFTKHTLIFCLIWKNMLGHGFSFFSPFLNSFPPPLWGGLNFEIYTHVKSSTYLAHFQGLFKEKISLIQIFFLKPKRTSLRLLTANGFKIGFLNVVDYHWTFYVTFIPQRTHYQIKTTFDWRCFIGCTVLYWLHQ